MTTILELEPIGLDVITFGTRDVDSATSGYYAPSSDYRFNESQRIEIIYSNTSFGGKAISEKQNLVPVTFSVFVIGSTRNEMLEKAQALNKALMNDAGGRLEYRPDGATISTYYHYEKSKPATVQEIKTNLWDGNTAESRRYVMAFDIELMTHPVATSGDPVSVTPSRATVFSTTYAGPTAGTTTYNYFDLYDIKGDLPAIVNISMIASTSDSYNRVYLWSRSSRQSILQELRLSYEANAATASGNWTSQVSTIVENSGGNYMRCEPTDYTTWHKLKFPIANEAEHRGFASIFISMRKNTIAGEFRVRLGYEVNNVRLWTSNTSYVTSVVHLNKWHYEYVGDIQLPPVALSKGQEINAQIVVEVQQISGTFDKDFDIDNMQIMFSDLSALQVNAGDEETQISGFSGTERLKLLSSLDLRCVPEIHNASNVYLRTTYGMYGSPPGILAEDDTRIFMMFERIASGSQNLYVPTRGMDITTTIIYRTIFPFGA